MSERFTFSCNGAEYHIDNTAYMDGTCEGVFFEVKRCPKCRKINAPSANNCHQCSNPLSEDSLCIASRFKRTGLGLWIGSGIWGVVVTTLNMVAKVRLGAIPTVVILGGCYFVGKSLAGRKIVIDKKATEDYKMYRTDQNK